MNNFRYWLSATLLGWSIRLVPDPSVRVVMKWGVLQGMKKLRELDLKEETEDEQ